TATPDYNNPGLVSCLLKHLGLVELPGLEIKQLGCGAIYGLDLASRIIASRQATCVLVVCVDLLSRYFGDRDRIGELASPQAHAAFQNFGDAAVACIVSGTLDPKSPSGFRLEAAQMRAVAEVESCLRCNLPSAKRFPQRIALEDVRAERHLPELFVERAHEETGRNMGMAISNFLSEQRLEPSDLKCILHNQLCAGLSELWAPELGVPVYDIFPRFGYVGAPGTLLSLLEVEQQGKLVRGDRVLLVGQSSGRHYAFQVLRKL
ncbi:MAG: hypothetical protein KDD42_09520, partial [Bdellovibrionales bacterium]|nr:hypothetical protein [Bdellovibrionales bacterium]